MAQQVRRRKQRTIQYSANNKTSESLSRGMVYREIYLRLRGAITVAGASNTTANTARGDEWGLIRKVDLVANNTNVIRSMSGNALWWLNLFLYGKRPRLSSAIGDGATANPSFDSTLILPLWIPQSIRPMDTALNSAELSDLKVEITWGDQTDINTAATGFTTSPVVDVYSMESFNIAGPFGQWRMFPIEREITSDNPDFQIHLPVGPIYRGFLMNFTDADVDSGAILNGMRLVSGSTVFADVDEEIFDLQNLRTGVDDGSNGQDSDLGRASASNSLDGWYYYDHVSDGFLSEGVDTLGFSEITLDLDVSVGAGTTKVIVYPSQIIPVRGGQAAG